MNNNTIAIWASVLTANIWAASSSDAGGFLAFCWVIVAAWHYIKDVRAARKADRMANSPK